MMADNKMLKLYVFFACLSTIICTQWRRLSEDPVAKDKLLNYIKKEAGPKLYQMNLEGTLVNYGNCFWNVKNDDIEQCEELVEKSVILPGYFDDEKSAIEVVNHVIDQWREKGRKENEAFKDFKEIINEVADKNSVGCIYGDVSDSYGLEIGEAKSSLASETDREPILLY
ncbi:unnamed protein product [Cylicocyclus nassatus]|uniref:Uncharacterized protein n=1 Tax=Cylicocyclus nassatus TaxID=53992 RepID=A0AA36DSP8_CYLNA|nr:unnamed protein product [Cylicocyclus nassatus]